MLILCRPEGKPVSADEYQLRKRQFDTMPNVVTMLADAGRLAAWVAEKTENGGLR